jgi:hypothetical protein
MRSPDRAGRRRLAALVEFLLQLREAAPETLRFHDAMGRQPHLVRRERLRYIVHGAPLDRANGALDRGKGRDHNHSDVWLAREHLGEEIEARFRAQPEIQEHDIEMPAVQGFESGAAGRHAEDACTRGLEAEAQ